MYAVYCGCILMNFQLSQDKHDIAVEEAKFNILTPQFQGVWQWTNNTETTIMCMFSLKKKNVLLEKEANRQLG